MSTFEIPKTCCPECGKEIDRASSLDNEAEKPKPNDLSICLDCTSVSYYQEDLSLKLLPKEEYDNLPNDLKSQVKYAQALVKMANGKKDS